MDWLDILLLAILVIASIHGLRVGAVTQVLGFGGLVLGLFVGALAAPTFTGFASSRDMKAIIAAITLFVAAALFATIGRFFGSRIVPVLRRVHLGGVDQVAGTAVAVVATLFVAWMAAGFLGDSPITALDRGIQHSQILRAADRVLPPTPSWVSRIQAVLDTAGFPTVFAGVAPTTAGPVKVASIPQVQEAVSRDRASTVKIMGTGCGEILEGSGFVVAPGLIVTNAHVIAGMHGIVAIDQSGTYHASPIYFDPHYDMAVLRVPGLREPVLPILDNLVPRGTQLAVLGYPGGGPFTARQAGVMAEFEAQGRDIYGQGLTVRKVYELQAIVRPGNSGGPLVEPDGTVVGIVFSRSVTNPDVGFALTSPGVLSRLQIAERSTGAVSTENCVGS